MSLQVDLNGYDSGLGTHVAIHAHIMRGRFDDALKWPFRGDVTIQIVNQAGDDKHHEQTISYTDEMPQANAGRVTCRERSNGWGRSQFISHGVLGYTAAKNTQYLQNDSLQIRISKIELNK